MDEGNKIGFGVFGDQVYTIFGRKILWVRSEGRPDATFMMAYLLFLTM
jgi:hypothetical protein